MKEKPAGFIDIDGTMYGKYGGFFIQPVMQGLVDDRLLDPFAWEAMLQLYNKSDPLEPDLGVEQRKFGFHEIAAQGLGGVLVADAHGSSYRVVVAEQDGFHPYLPELVRRGRVTHTLYVASAQPQFSTSAVARYHNIDYVSTIYEADQNGRFTGQVDWEREAITSVGKAKMVLEKLAIHGREGSFFIGDSSGDRDSLRVVERGYCVNPDEVIRGEMEVNRWIELDPTTTDCVTLIFPQGIHVSVFET